MTSPFKRMIQRDIKNVFINSLEFADTHLLNGVPVRCVVDEDIYRERLSVTINSHVEGVYADYVTVFVEVSDLPARPVKGELFRLDGQRYVVEETSETNGVYEIVLEGSRQ